MSEPLNISFENRAYLEEIQQKELPQEEVVALSDKAARWMEAKVRENKPLTQQQEEHALELITKAELFETFLHTKFVGQKRFSLEGAETLIPMLSFIIEQASLSGVTEVVLGMTHRGRLNVLAHIFQKPLSDIISEFKDLEYDVLEGSGDVKYHKGHSAVIDLLNDRSILITMISNPSHLESVDPVATGFTRGRQKELQDTSKSKVLPIIIHGDAAISGQGVVYETLQLSRLKGYEVGGTIHIVLNNHIGFTALPEDSRSTEHCTDIAKAFGYPVFHVDAEDPRQAVKAALLAQEFRHEMHEDVFIDLSCYRKYGHNESDEPAFTQPLLYEEIRKKKSIGKLFLESLGKSSSGIEESYRNTLQEAFSAHEMTKKTVEKETKKTALALPSENELYAIAIKLSTLPESFNVHHRIKRNFDERLAGLMAKKGESKIDFAFAEALSFGSLIEKGVPIRLTGQDSRRGTFSQRHAVLVDQKTNACYVPLQACKNGDALFEVYDSPLSEYAALGFEYGYTLASQKSLVMWEAQFGDFANGAQIVIDQYIAAGESKWGVSSTITLLLPHGYEGQGPEHSSGRMERFLQLAAEDNICIAVPTTPSQYFHLLYTQPFCKKPLIVFTPKGLLRHPECVSSLHELSQGHFLEVIDDQKERESINEIIFCQGKVYYEVKGVVGANQALVRIERLYPFPEKQVTEILTKYTKATKWSWLQEEPMNAGAWNFMNSQFRHLGKELRYVGRAASASPATGSHEMHKKQHAQIIKELRS